MVPPMCARSCGFDPRSPRGERLDGMRDCRSTGQKFRSALPARGATRRLCRRIGKRCFDPRSRAGSDYRQACSDLPPQCFDPRSRAGSDRRAGQHAKARKDVSIRAPARGATPLRMHGPMRADRFRSALPRGERRITEQYADRPGFRSALPRGERHYASLLSSRHEIVSIRAPARGATSRRSQPWRSRRFDPRSRAGSDRRRSVPASWRRGFDPRSRAGSDIAAHRSATVTDVSIRAPARGATRRHSRMRQVDVRFRSALPRGERRASASQQHQRCMFRSALPRGERRYEVRRGAQNRHVSIRAPARGATTASCRPA